MGKALSAPGHPRVAGPENPQVGQDSRDFLQPLQLDKGIPQRVPPLSFTGCCWSLASFVGS